jgi:RNA polymerase sigma-70 factor (ECF subfamily)
MDAETLLRHDPFVRSLARSLVRGAEEADDVAQETWVAALEHPPRPGPGLRGWLATVARNVVRQGRRRRARRIERETRVARSEGVPSDGEIRAREALRRRVVEAVLALPAPARDVVVLRHLEDVPPREIARRLGLPVETVKTRLKRALARLRTDLDDLHGGDRRAWLPGVAALAGSRLGAGLLAAPTPILVAALLAMIAGAVLVLPRVVAPPPPPVEAGERAGEASRSSHPRDATTVGADDRATARAGRELPPGTILVVDAQDRPARATVRTTPETLADVQKAVVLGRTDADGALVPSRFERWPRTWVWAQGGGVAGPVARDADGVTVLRLGEGAVIEGRVVTPDGGPVAGVSVAARARTDREGRFRIPGCFPGTPYDLGVEFDPRTGHWIGPTVVLEPGESRRELEIVHRPRESTVLLVSLDAPAGARGQGRIAIDGAEPWEAEFSMPGSPLVRIPADRLRGRAVRVGARLPGYRAEPVAVEVPEAEGTVEVRLTLVPGGLPARGRVVDAEGEPVAGARILAAEDPANPRGHEQEARTDDDGEFAIPAAWLGRSVIAFREGRDVSEWLALREETADVTLRLGPGGVVEGRVLAADDGQPVPGVDVVLQFGNESGNPWTFRSRSDDEGRYRFDGVPLATLAWPRIPDGLRSLPQDRENPDWAKPPGTVLREGAATVLERSGQVWRHDVLARRRTGIRLDLALSVPAGVPAPVRVHVLHRFEGWRRWDEDVDPADPRLELFLPEGEHRIVVRTLTHWASPGPIRVRAGDRDRALRLELAPRPVVLVRAVDAEGAPLERRDLVVTAWDREVPTDSHGVADISDLLGPPAPWSWDDGRLPLAVTGPGLFHGGREHPARSVPFPELLRLVEEASGAPVVLDVPVRPALELEVPVLDADDRPVPHVRVALEPAGCFAAPEATSDEDGILRIGILETDDRHAVLTALPPHIGRRTVRDLLERPDEHSLRVFGRQDVLRVALARTVAVTVLGDDGEPLADHPVWLWRAMWGFDREQTRTDPDGRLRVAVPRGREVGIQVGAAGRSEARVGFDPERSSAVARLFTMRTLEVEVVAPAGCDADRVWLEIPAPYDGDRDPPRPARGPFRTTLRIPRRATRIEALTADRWWQAETTAAPDAVRVRLVLRRMPAHPVRLRFADEEGRALAGRRVRLDAGPVFEGERTTDAGGRVTVDLPPGPMGYLRYQLEGRTVHQEQVPTFSVPDAAEIEVRPEDPWIQGVVLRGAGHGRTTAALVRADGARIELPWVGGRNDEQRFRMDPDAGPGRIEVRCGDRTFGFDYPGHPVGPPTFDLDER